MLRAQSTISPHTGASEEAEDRPTTSAPSCSAANAASAATASNNAATTAIGMLSDSSEDVTLRGSEAPRHRPRHCTRVTQLTSDSPLWHFVTEIALSARDGAILSMMRAFPPTAWNMACQLLGYP